MASESPRRKLDTFGALSLNNGWFTAMVTCRSDGVRTFPLTHAGPKFANIESNPEYPGSKSKPVMNCACATPSNGSASKSHPLIGRISRAKRSRCSWKKLAPPS